MRTHSETNIYKNAQRFAKITKWFLISGNISRAKRCIQKAENIFNTGNSQSKNVISNVYVFSVSSFLETHHFNIKNLFPESLIHEYRQQIHTVDA